MANERIAGQPLTYRQGQQFVLAKFQAMNGYYVGPGAAMPAGGQPAAVPQPLVQPTTAQTSANQNDGPASLGNSGEAVYSGTQDTNNPEQEPNMDGLFGVWDANDPYAIGPRPRVSRDDPYF